MLTAFVFWRKKVKVVRDEHVEREYERESNLSFEQGTETMTAQPVVRSVM